MERIEFKKLGMGILRVIGHEKELKKKNEIKVRKQRKGQSETVDWFCSPAANATCCWLIMP